VSFLKEHPVVTLALGAALGVVFYSQIKRLPVVNKLPSA
jgi:hypothetical protein